MPLLTMAMLMLAPPPIRIDPKQAPPPVILTVPTPVPVMVPPTPPPAPPPSPPGTPARPINQMAWIGTDDYPSAALRREAEGLVRVLLVVDLDGVPNDCTIQSSSGHADLDATACTLLRQRARFHPALDGEGQPVIGRIIVPVRWAIPDGLPPLPVPPVTK